MVDLKCALDDPILELTDIMFKIDGETIYASKFLLASRSAYFRSLFCGNFDEAYTDVIEIKGTSYQSFYTVILYLYTNYLEDLPTHEAENVLRLANQYLILDLEAKMCRLILTHITVENSTRILLLAHDLNILVMKQLAMDFVLDKSENFDILTQCPELLLEVTTHLAKRIRCRAPT
eukprot:TRINITY_DN6088_c0_g1_i2.p1 TRINITY_DN6088_c0_g1~~TRINITY_DN6088_c0_g1_i2.p1  ORF type:complete len:177 (-),score=31.72 TRINITY_DN6088_c0_g1_i2:641-1171(-)